MDAEILRALIEIKRFVAIVAVITTILAIAFIASIVLNLRQNSKNVKSGDFFDRGNSMLNRGQLDELLALCETQLSENPADPTAHWLKANALYRRRDWHNALISYRKADELQTGWSLGPAIAELEEKVAQATKPPDLKVVTPVDSKKDDA